MPKIDFPQTIRDKFGVTYRLDAKLSSSQWVVRIRAPQGGGEIGHAHCIPEGKVLRLMDLCVRKDFRRKGLGSALLKTVVEAARYHYKQVKGVMKEGDLKEYPDLPDWYAQNGFQVESTDAPIAFSQLVWSKPQPGAIPPTRAAVEAAVIEWVRKYPFVQKVWLYGSRISGISSGSGNAPKPDADWDVAVEVSGGSEEQRYQKWKGVMDRASDEMNALTNWKVDVQLCDFQFRADSKVATGVEKFGVLVYERV